MSALAIIRRPNPTPKENALACAQHAAYVEALRHARITILELPEGAEHPDAVFVEDTAFILDEFAILARPCAIDRQAEIPPVAAALSPYRHLVQAPAGICFAGSDLLSIGRRVYIGQTSHINAEAIDYLRRLLRQYQRQVIVVPVSAGRSLKSAVTFLGGNTVLLNTDWVPREVFALHRQIEVDPEEPSAANALRAGRSLIVDGSHTRTGAKLRAAGFVPDLLDLSEFQRTGRGPTGLSILLNGSGPV